MLNWFHRLKVAQKLTLISVFFIIPDSIMLYLFITSINENINVARLEQAGNEYQRAVEPLLRLLSEHRLLVRDDLGSRDAKAIARVRGEIDTAFDALTQVNARIGTTLDFTPAGLQKRNRQGCEVGAVRQAWAGLRDDSDRLADSAVDQRHLDLIANLRAMIAHAGDNSNLILDPELDSYYLMDATLLALPQTQDRLTQIMVDAVQRLDVTGTAHEERERLAIDLTLLRSDDQDRIVGSIQTALSNGNPTYGPNLSIHQRIPPLVKSYQQANTDFANLIEKLRKPHVTDVSKTDILTAGRTARDASFALWFAADSELDHLLQYRINYYVDRRTRSLAVAACALMAAALLVTFITRSISGPLKKQAAALKVALEQAEAERILAENRLVQQQKTEAELRATQHQLVTASRQAGMAEVATGVLHNVGNVLNSVNVSVHVIKDQVEGSQISKLSRTADMIDAHTQDIGAFLSNDTKGKLIPGYVSKLARLLDHEHEAMLAEIENLSRGVEHIKQVVKFQQNYAKPSNVLEAVEPGDLLEEALRLNVIALDRHGVTIVREVEDIASVRIDKHKTLQILVNLISNAKNAMSDLNGNEERRLTLGMTTVDSKAGSRLRITVSDNGIGIAPEHIKRIFAHGFTTRAEGHGFGLHSAINAAREMGGNLEVFSAGRGHGATFTLDIPLAAEEVAV